MTRLYTTLASACTTEYAASLSGVMKPNDANVAAAGAAGSACVLALALDWVRPSRSADDATAAAAQSAALAAAAHEHRAAYHWQLLRLYGKYLARRRTGLVDRYERGAARCRRPLPAAAWLLLQRRRTYMLFGQKCASFKNRKDKEHK